MEPSLQPGQIQCRLTAPKSSKHAPNIRTGTPPPKSLRPDGLCFGISRRYPLSVVLTAGGLQAILNMLFGGIFKGTGPARKAGDPTLCAASARGCDLCREWNPGESGANPRCQRQRHFLLCG